MALATARMRTKLSLPYTPAVAANFDTYETMMPDEIGYCSALPCRSCHMSLLPQTQPNSRHFWVISCMFGLSLNHNTSHNWLWQATVSPPRLQDAAWCPPPEGQKLYVSRYSGHKEPLATSKPNHHFRAVKNSLGSRWRPSVVEGNTSKMKGCLREETSFICYRLYNSNAPLGMGTGNVTISSDIQW